MAARLESTQETWRLDPPVVAERAYSSGQYAIHILMRTQPVDGDVWYWAKGVPLTKTGKPNGVIDWRSIKDEDMEKIVAMIPDAHPSDI